MAQQYTTIGSTFNPYSFQDYYAPLAIKEQKHMQQQAAYDELALKLENYANLIDPETEADSYAIYERYKKQLDQAYNDLNTKGYTGSAPTTLSNLRKLYAQEVTPLNLGYTNRTAQAQKQQADKDKDSTIVYSRDAATTPLDLYLKNPNLQYQSYSGDDVYRRTAQMFANAKTAEKARNGYYNAPGEASGQYFESKTVTGYTPKDIENYKANYLSRLAEATNVDQLTGGNGYLDAGMRNIIDNSNILKWEGMTDENGNFTDYGKEQMSRFINYALMGTDFSIGKTDRHTLANRGWQDPNDRDKDNNPPYIQRHPVNPFQLYSKEQLNEQYNTSVDKKEQDQFIKFVNSLRGGQTTYKEFANSVFERARVNQDLNSLEKFIYNSIGVIGKEKQKSLDTMYREALQYAQNQMGLNNYKSKTGFNPVLELTADELEAIYNSKKEAKLNALNTTAYYLNFADREQAIKDMVTDVTYSDDDTTSIKIITGLDEKKGFKLDEKTKVKVSDLLDENGKLKGNAQIFSTFTEGTPGFGIRMNGVDYFIPTNRDNIKDLYNTNFVGINGNQGQVAILDQIIESAKQDMQEFSQDSPEYIEAYNTLNKAMIERENALSNYMDVATTSYTQTVGTTPYKVNNSITNNTYGESGIQ